MATPNLQLTGGNFQNAAGAVIAGGQLLFMLSHDESYASGPNQVVAGQKFTVTLDNNGNIPVSPAFMVYDNADLLPSGSFYLVRLFDATGAEVWASPQIWTLLATPNPLNVATIVPSSPPGVGLSGGSATLLLQTNETNNGSQSLLDLHAGSNITLTDNGVGRVTIAATGGPSFSGSGAFMFGPGLRDVASVLGGNWGAPNANSVNGSRTGNQVTVYLFQLDVAMTISKVTTQCTNNAIGPTASFGIYSFAGNKLVDGGSFTTLSASVQTNSITPATLQPGIYWHAQACSTNTAAATFSGVSVSSNSATAAIPLYVKNATRTGTAANAMSGGVLPATLGTVTLFTPTNADGVCCPLYE